MLCFIKHAVKFVTCLFMMKLFLIVSAQMPLKIAVHLMFSKNIISCWLYDRWICVRLSVRIIDTSYNRLMLLIFLHKVKCTDLKIRYLSEC